MSWTQIGLGGDARVTGAAVPPTFELLFHPHFFKRDTVSLLILANRRVQEG
jgi:hypothetical protein